MQPTIVLTRPQSQAEVFAADLTAAHGAPLPILIAPLMAIEAVAKVAPFAPPDHVIFTSANAVKEVDRLAIPRGAIAWCVGDQTSAAAAAAGFEVENAHGDSADLVARMIAAQPTGQILHLHGAHTTGHVAENLAAAGLPCDARVVYRQLAQPASAELRMAFQGNTPLIVPVFSPRSAKLLAQVGPIDAPFTAVAISETVAQTARALLPADVIVANFPDKAAMILATLTALRSAGRRKTR